MRRSFRFDEQEVLRTWLPAGFLALLIFLLGLGYAAFVSVGRIIEHSTLSQHTVEVERTIEEVQSALSAAESAQRGFLLSGEQSYVRISTDESSEAIKSASYLSQLVLDNPEQSRRAQELQGIVSERVARLHSVMDAVERAGPNRARDMVKVIGPQLAERARKLSKEMLLTEKNLLVQRNAQREESIRIATMTFAISGVVSLGLMTSLYNQLRKFLIGQGEAKIAAESHRKALEAEIYEKERAERELQRSNRELQDFAFVASHDLQEPLRKIQAFGDRLRSKNEGVLDETSLDYLARMQNAANRMQELINALLNLSRITTKAQPFATVSLEAVLAVVVEDLQSRLEESGGTVSVKKLPSLQADRVQMRQLFQNLVGNALKFRAEGRPPRVVIREVSTQNEGMVRVEVSDNGVGFEERHAEKIFAIFQRLHGRGEYEGSGIGLAVCRRIVDRHGGSITASSVPGEGATFTIELPRKQPEAKI